MAIEHITEKKVYIALADDGYPENPDVGAIIYFLDTQEKYIYADGEWNAYSGFVL